MNAGRPVRVTAKLRSELQAARSARSARRKAEAAAAVPVAETKATETKTTTPRTRNREWGFFGTCASEGHADPEAAWNEAMAVLTDAKGHFRLEPEDARDLLDATWGRHLADQVVGEKIAKAINDLAVNHGWARDARTFVRKHINQNLAGERTTRPGKDELLAEIARGYLKIETLDEQHSDRADFHQVAVWNLKDALRAAYDAGRKSAHR